MIEIRMSREVAILLGAFEPMTLEEYRACVERGGTFKVRDPRTMQVLFWPFVGAPPMPRS